MGKRFDLRSQRCQEKEKHRAQIQDRGISFELFHGFLLRSQISHQNIRHRRTAEVFIFMEYYL